MSFRPSKWVIYAPVALLPFQAAFVLESRSLQNDIANRVLQNLHKVGATWAKSLIDGRDVTVSGDAPGTEQVDAAIAAVLGTRGVRRVDSMARIVEPPPAAPTIKPVSGMSGKFTIAGTWPEAHGNGLKLVLAGTSWVLGKDPALVSNAGIWTLSSDMELDPGAYDVVSIASGAMGLTTADTTKDELTVLSPPPDLLPPTIQSIETNSATPALHGTWDQAVAKSLAVKIGDSLYKLGTDAALTANAGNWTLAVPQPLPDGSYDVSAEVGDELGRSAAAVIPGRLVIDTKPPEAPAIGFIDLGPPLQIGGIWPAADAKLLIARLAGKTWTLGSDQALTTDDRGNWNLLPGFVLAPGTYDVEIEISDHVGNISRDMTRDEIVVPVPPPLPEMTPPTVQPLLTNSRTPEITGTWPSAVAKMLSVIAGQSSYVLGTAKELVTTGDNWTLELSTPLADGDYDIRAEASDGAGRTVASLSSARVTIDTVAPKAPAISPVTPVLPLRVSGSWAENDAVSLLIRLEGKAWKLGSDAALSTDGKGTWSFAPGLDLKPGTYDLEVAIADRAGNIARDATRDEIVIAEPLPPPVMTMPTVVAAEQMVARPVIKGTWSEIVAKSLSVTLAGRSFALGMDAELTTDGIGNWTLAVPTPLADGTYDVKVQSADASGTTLSDVTRDELVIDARGPGTPTVTLHAGTESPTRILGTWDQHNATSLHVAIPARNIAVKFGEGAALTSANGRWTWTLPSPLTAGSYDVAVETTDAKGRIARDETRFEIFVSELPPPPPMMKAPTVATYGREETPASISGTWDEAVAKSLAVSIDGADVKAQLGTDAALRSDGKGNWSLALGEKLAPGIYDVAVVTTDSAGNTAADRSTAELYIKAPPPPPPYDCEGAFSALAPAVHFDFNSWNLSAVDSAAIHEVASLLNDKRCIDWKLEIAGHADYYGGTLYNRALSIRRAQVVVGELGTYGLDIGRAAITGMGEGAPDLPDRTRDARARNRRAVMTIVK